MFGSVAKLIVNYLKTGVLVAALTALFGLVGYAIGGMTWAVGALVLAGVLNLLALWQSDKMVLAAHHAMPVTRADNPPLYDMVERLARRAQLPMPALYVIPDDAPNAFATGRSPRHAAVAVTAGILRMMTDRELEGVLAHELAHVRNRDMLIQTVTATIAGAISMLANVLSFAFMFGGAEDDEGGGLGVLLMLILAPLLAMIVQMAISRGREYEADRVGAEIAGSPMGLARALERLEAYHEQAPSRLAMPAMQHLYIAQPLTGGTLASLFSTHPPIEDRVRRLRGMAMS